MTKTPSSDDGCGCQSTPGKRTDTAVERAIESLREHEEKLRRTLEDPSEQQRFLESPKAVFDSLGIALPTELVHHLARHLARARAAVGVPSSIVLPNGQRIRPRVRVRITDGTKEG